MALAGTAPVSREARDFLSDPKELHEHLLVVQNLKEILSTFGMVDQGPTEVLELPALQHLKTELSAKIETKTTWQDLLQKLHPTAALGTYPPQHWKWLKELPEQTHRKTFGAPFGVQFSSEFQLAIVGIRQIQWDHQGIRIGAGCGIVKESLFEKEWQEILLKISSVKKMFGWV